MGAPMYNPQAFEGGGQGPVSGSVAKAGYLTTALNSLESAYIQKRERQGQQLTTKAQLAHDELSKAQDNLKKYGNDPQLATQMKQAEAEALENVDKVQKELQKHFGADKTVWGALWDKIHAGTMKQGQKGAGGASGAKPAGGPPPPAAGGAPPKQPQAPSTYAVMANIDAARDISEGKTEDDIAQEKQVQAAGALQKAKDDAVRQVELKAAQQSYIKTIQGVMTGSVNIDDAIQQVTQTTATTFPDNPKSIPEHIIATVNGALRLPKYANDPKEVQRLNKILSDQYAVLAGESGKYPPRGFAPKFPSGKQAEMFERAGVAPDRPLGDYSPEEWNKVSSVAQTDAEELLRKAHSMEGVHGDAAKYHQFQAKTKADQESIGVLKSRVGQMESLLANPLSNLTDEQKDSMKAELGNTRSQLTDSYESIKSAFHDIYGGGDTKAPATPPAPKATGPIPGLSKAGEEYLQGIGK